MPRRPWTAGVGNGSSAGASLRAARLDRGRVDHSADNLLRQRMGADAANRVAGRLVVAPHRQGGQAQFIEQPIPSSAKSSRLSELIDWVRSHLKQPHTVDSLADRAVLSRRTFTRQMRSLTGMTVLAWLHAERLLPVGDASPAAPHHVSSSIFGLSP